MKKQTSKFIEALEIESAKTTTDNGAEAYATTTNNNLDLFAVGSRDIEISSLVKSAWAENQELTLANILYLLDIRAGKGERKHFLASMLALRDIGVRFTKDGSLTMTKLIVDLGRVDYAIKLAYNGVLDKEIVYGYMLDNIGNNSLIAKWMPSINTSSKETVAMAKDIINIMGFNSVAKLNGESNPQKYYRRMLSLYREDLNLVETNLSQKNYANINYSQVPTKAMLKYREAFKRHDGEKYAKFFEDLKNGVKDVKINTTGLFVYEIIEKIQSRTIDVDLAEQMWKNQKDFIPKEFKDVKAMVVADTSGSMNGRPLATSIGLSMYFAERNTGLFKDHFITFSKEAKLVKIQGKNIVEKLNSFVPIVEDTNILSVYKLLLKTALANKLKQSDFPEYLIIVSDMQFNETEARINPKTGREERYKINYDEARKLFKDHGYKLPKIIYWNVSNNERQTFEVTSNDKNVATIGGFSTAIFSNLFSLETLTPEKQMIDTLKKYVDLIKIDTIIDN
jgi:hypothetical protein